MVWFMTAGARVICVTRRSGLWLYTYKRDNVPLHYRRQRSVLIAAVLWRRLARHERCLARMAGLATDQFDVITSVPSTSGREEAHPLENVVGGVVAGSAERYRGLLRLNRDDISPREVARDRFAAASQLPGTTVLLIDDTWTTGAKMQSASAALKLAGATSVGGVAIGRWFKNGYRENTEWLRNARKIGWSWSTCCLE
jgi:predicted amidophosphoribosyltransferase